MTRKKRVHHEDMKTRSKPLSTLRAKRHRFPYFVFFVSSWWFFLAVDRTGRFDSRSPIGRAEAALVNPLTSGITSRTAANTRGLSGE
jgi:hypothetical protein